MVDFDQEPPNECLVVANDLEQARARAFASCEGIIEHNPELRAECEVLQKNIFCNNGTSITAISSDYQGASGSNHGWVSYEEIWAVTSENGRRLFEELTSVSTRRNSVKFVATYSGFEGESELLMDLYKKSVGKEGIPTARENASTPSCRSTSTVKQGSSATGTMRLECMADPGIL